MFVSPLSCKHIAECVIIPNIVFFFFLHGVTFICIKYTINHCYPLSIAIMRDGKKQKHQIDLIISILNATLTQTLVSSKRASC